MKKILVLSALFLFPGVSALAQQFPPGFVDPMPLLAAASEEIGEQNFRCVTFSGAGYSGVVGQTFENAVNIDWPRIPMTNYTRTINWETATSIETFDREPGPQSRLVEIRARLDGRHAHPEADASDLYRERRYRVGD